MTETEQEKVGAKRMTVLPKIVVKSGVDELFSVVLMHNERAKRRNIAELT